MGKIRKQPTRAQVDRAIEAAARLCGEDPDAVRTSKKNTQARAYAFQALRQVFDISMPLAAVLCGGSSSESRTSYLRTAHVLPWFRDGRLRIVVAAITQATPGAERDDVRHYAPMPHRVSHVRPAEDMQEPLTVHAQPASLTALLCGDPLPGRSALDQRRGVAG